MSISDKDLLAKINSSEYSVIHIDAVWDNYREEVQSAIQEVKVEFKDKVFFGYADCEENQEYISTLKLLNTPSIAYYRGEKLVSIIIGKSQNIRENLNKIMSGEALD